MKKIACFSIFILLVFCFLCGNAGAQLYGVPTWATELLADISLYPDQYVMGVGAASTPTPVINFPEKRFQTNIIFCPFVGWIPCLGAIGFDAKYKAVPEEEIMPEINIGAGYWNWFLLNLVNTVSSGKLNMSMYGWNANLMLTKTTAERVRHHFGIQYNRTDGGINVNMGTGGGTIPSIPSSISLRTERLDLFTGVDYALSRTSTAYFLIGYDILHTEVFERIGFAFGGFIIQVGIYPGSKFAIIPSLEWAISF